MHLNLWPRCLSLPMLVYLVADLCSICATFMFHWGSLAFCPPLSFLLSIHFPKHLACTFGFTYDLYINWHKFISKIQIKKIKHQCSFLEIPLGLPFVPQSQLVKTWVFIFLSPCDISSVPIFPRVVTWRALCTKHESLRTYYSSSIYPSNSSSQPISSASKFQCLLHLSCQLCPSLSSSFLYWTILIVFCLLSLLLVTPISTDLKDRVVSLQNCQARRQGFWIHF